MNKISFEDMLEQFTEFNFHDAVLQSVFFCYEEGNLKLSIKHYRITDEEEVSIDIKSHLDFHGVKNIRVDNVYETFFLCRSINSFEEKADEKSNRYYELMGISGWTLKFEAEELYYSEVIIDE